jgi:hypothetical protein
VLGRHVDGLEVVGEVRLVHAHHSTEVAPTQLTNWQKGGSNRLIYGVGLH